MAIQRKNLAAEQQMLELQKEEEYARLLQEREIAIRRAQQQSQITVETAEMKRTSEGGARSTPTRRWRRRAWRPDRTLRQEEGATEQQIKQIEDPPLARTIEIAETERHARRWKSPSSRARSRSPSTPSGATPCWLRPRPRVRWS